MAGRIVDRRARRTEHWDRFVLEFADGGRLALHDQRRLGRAVIDPTSRTSARTRPRSHAISSGSGWAAARWRSRRGCSTRSRSPASATCSRTRRCGARGSAPERSSGELSEEELDHLRRVLRAATRAAIRKGGVHTGDFIPTASAAAPCPRCGTTVERATIGGRTTFWCPNCQPVDAAPRTASAASS